MQYPFKLSRSIVAVAIAGFLAAPALAGNEIVKCVDAEGRVTLTDQPCEGGATTLTASSVAPRPQPQRQPLRRVALRHEAWQPPPANRPAALSRDIATLKEARRMLMLQETRPQLAGLD